MDTHDIPEEDSPENWAQRRISDLKATLADDQSGDLSDVQYYDEPLGDAHDDEGYYDDSREDSRSLYAVGPTWWQNILVRLWFRWRWIIPLTALLIPLLLFVGGIVALTMLSGSDDDSAPVPGSAGSVTSPAASPVPAAEWPPDMVFAEHTIPAMIRNELFLAGAMHGYVFTGVSGELWRIEVEPSDGSALDPLLRVYDPNGHELVNNDNRTTGDSSTEVVVILPQDGAYRVVIQAAGEGLTTGEYWLMVSGE